MISTFLSQYFPRWYGVGKDYSVIVSPAPECATRRPQQSWQSIAKGLAIATSVAVATAPKFSCADPIVVRSWGDTAGKWRVELLDYRNDLVEKNTLSDTPAEACTIIAAMDDGMNGVVFAHIKPGKWGMFLTLQDDVPPTQGPIEITSDGFPTDEYKSIITQFRMNTGQMANRAIAGFNDSDWQRISKAISLAAQTTFAAPFGWLRVGAAGFQSALANFDTCEAQAALMSNSGR
jgi:hypothetical protein